jgi:hypothetical protein
MQIIIGIIFILLFLGVAPKFMKTLVVANIGIVVFGFIALKIVAMFMGVGKGGGQSFVLEEYAKLGFELTLSVPGLMLLGIILGFAANRVESTLHKKKMEKPD